MSAIDRHIPHHAALHTVMPAAAAARRMPAWLWVLAVVLAGYAFLGKGWAYIGVPPVFIGEIALALGVASLAFSGGILRLPPMPQLAILAVLMAWGAWRTLPFISEFGTDALRDAVLWAYGAMAFVVLLHVVKCPRSLERLVGCYRVFAAVFLVATPCLWLARYLAGGSMPRWPWADVPVIDPKPGDVMVHLAGVLAFWVSGLAGRVSWPLVLLMGACAAVIGAYERAGMFAFATAFLLCLTLRPLDKSLRRLGALAVLSIAALAATGAVFDVPVPDSAKVREVSFRQLVHNVRSALGDTDMGDLDDTKHWRLEWWRQIADYTFRGPWFWTGKGFGVNLADDDGFQVMPDHSLRSPHNGHLTFLARAGVPGLVLWTLTQVGWVWAVVRGYIASTLAGRRTWAGLFIFLLGYWLAFMVNATFDVFLEGPMGGLWFWTIYGAGLAAAWLYRQRAAVFCDDAHTAGA